MSDNQDKPEEPPLLDEVVAQQVIGKSVLVGITYVNSHDELIEQRQLHGVIESVTSEDGIAIRLGDGKVFRLPPDLRGIEPAAPGIYRLRSTGEEVENPDYVWTWTVTSPDQS